MMKFSEEEELLFNYPWWSADHIARVWAVVGAIVLLYYTLGGNGVKCSTEIDRKDAFTGTQVVMFNQVCEDHGLLFALMLTVAFSARWWRTLLGWEAGQEARVILKKPRGNKSRGSNVMWQYQSTLLQSTLLYLLEVVFIISQNLWVFLSVVISQQISTWYYLLRSPSDEERDAAHKRRKSRKQQRAPPVNRGPYRSVIF